MTIPKVPGGDDQDSWFIQALAVHGDIAGRQWGRSLLDDTLTILSERGVASWAYWKVHTDNAASHIVSRVVGGKVDTVNSTPRVTVYAVDL